MSTDDPVDGVALCLSGGGYRAMLFHVGVVWRLHDAGWRVLYVPDARAVHHDQ